MHLGHLGISEENALVRGFLLQDGVFDVQVQPDVAGHGVEGHPAGEVCIVVGFGCVLVACNAQERYDDGIPPECTPEA